MRPSWWDETSSCLFASCGSRGRVGVAIAACPRFLVMLKPPLALCQVSTTTRPIPIARSRRFTAIPEVRHEALVDANCLRSTSFQCDSVLTESRLADDALIVIVPRNQNTAGRHIADPWSLRVQLKCPDPSQAQVVTIFASITLALRIQRAPVQWPESIRGAISTDQAGTAVISLAPA